jgi:hypothetical protein
MRSRDFVELGIFDTELETRRFLSRYEHRGILNSTVVKNPVRFTGDPTTGREPKLWTHNWRCSKPRHDDLLRRLTLEVIPERFTCRQVDPDILPDAEWWFGDEHYFVELDMGTTPIKTLEANRVTKYAKFADEKSLVLWFIYADTDALAERNLQAMLNRDWGSNHLFTLAKTFLKDPFNAEAFEFRDNGHTFTTGLPETVGETQAKPEPNAV